VTYLVNVLDEVKTEDIPALPDREVQRAAAEILRQLYTEPRIGEPMRERYNLGILKDCRKIAFDRADWRGKPRFRFVFRNEPGDTAVDRVTVLAIGSREGLAAYRSAATRRGRQKRSTRT
jgi:hypothetical protein